MSQIQQLTALVAICFCMLMILGFARRDSTLGLSLMWVGTLGMLGVVMVTISRAITVT